MSAAVSMAILQYVQATNDTAVLTTNPKLDDLLTGIAMFLVSKAQFNAQTEKFEYKGNEDFNFPILHPLKISNKF